MSVVIANLASGTLTTSTVAIYTSAAGVTTRITHANIVNYSGGASTYTAYRVASGGSAADSNRLTAGKSVATLATDQCPEITGLVLGPSESLQIVASANTALTYALSGQKITQ